MAQSNVDQLKEIIVIGAGEITPYALSGSKSSIDFYVQASLASPLH